MDPIIWIAAAVLLLFIVFRFIFKLTGLIIKLILLAGTGFALWWVFSGL